jgi:hypothetical protein
MPFASSARTRGAFGSRGQKRTASSALMFMCIGGRSPLAARAPSPPMPEAASSHGASEGQAPPAQAPSQEAAEQASQPGAQGSEPSAKAPSGGEAAVAGKPLHTMPVDT